jgi:hypothetical protein
MPDIAATQGSETARLVGEKTHFLLAIQNLPYLVPLA